MLQYPVVKDFNEVNFMNVYDTANELARGIRDSQEFKRMTEAKQKLSLDAQATDMVNDFMRQSKELEFEKMSGRTPDKDKIEKVQKLYEVLSINPAASDYIQASIRFQMMINDISKTIGDVIKEAAGE